MGCVPAAFALPKPSNAVDGVLRSISSEDRL
jgi:hypothetical protein